MHFLSVQGFLKCFIDCRVLRDVTAAVGLGRNESSSGELGRNINLFLDVFRDSPESVGNTYVSRLLFNSVGSTGYPMYPLNNYKNGLMKANIEYFNLTI